ncbi:MAG: antitoxin family protein [Nitrospirota bacterium]
MPKTITAVYENGVFKPLKKVKLHEHQKVELDIHTEDETDNAIKTALSIIGIGKSSFKDTALKHDEYLYGKNRSALKKRR